MKAKLNPDRVVLNAKKENPVRWAQIAKGALIVSPLALSTPAAPKDATAGQEMLAFTTKLPNVPGESLRVGPES
jgi:hypothetical protein